VAKNNQVALVHAGCEDELNELMSGLRRLSAESGISASTLSIGWILAQRGVATAIVGCRSTAQLHANVESALTPIPEDVLSELTRISEPIKTLMHGDLDLWRPGADTSRIR